MRWCLPTTTSSLTTPRYWAARSVGPALRPSTSGLLIMPDAESQVSVWGVYCYDFH